MSDAPFEIPDSVAASTDAGNTVLQAFREWRGFETEQLAAAASVPADHIALHERDAWG